jgi:transposase
MAGTRRSFTDNFKREAVRLAEEPGSVSKIAQDLGIDPSVLSRWIGKCAVAHESRPLASR